MNSLSVPLAKIRFWKDHLQLTETILTSTISREFLGKLLRGNWGRTGGEWPQQDLQMLEQEPFQQRVLLWWLQRAKLCIPSAALLLWWLLLINPIVLLLSVSCHTLGVTHGTEESIHGFPGSESPCSLWGLDKKPESHSLRLWRLPFSALQPPEDRILLFPSGFAVISKDLCEIFSIPVPSYASWWKEGSFLCLHHLLADPAEFCFLARSVCECADSSRCTAPSRVLGITGINI